MEILSLIRKRENKIIKFILIKHVILQKQQNNE